MKKNFKIVAFLTLFFLISCDHEKSSSSVSDKPVIKEHQYETYKSIIEDTDWYRNLINDSRIEKVEFILLPKTSIKEPIHIKDNSMPEEKN